ncbi:F-box/LRR-repeat protein 7 [Gryllus bimaculatus]|nr:F-box/LRR-repeat protein 7 [Gryllus bimaculatus]
MFRAAAKKVCELVIDICGSFVSDAVGNRNSPGNNEAAMARSQCCDAPPPKRSKRLQEKCSSPRGGGPPPTPVPRPPPSAPVSRRTPCEAPPTPPPTAARHRHLGVGDGGPSSSPPSTSVAAAAGATSWKAACRPCASCGATCRGARCLRRELALEGACVDTAAACELLRGCPNLEELGDRRPEDDPSLLRRVAAHNHELRRLAIKRCNGSPVRPYLAAHILNKLLRRCPRLVDLTIKQSTFRSNKFFRDLGVMLPDIRRLNLNFSSSFGSDALKMIALHCGKLEEIRALRKRTPNSTVPHCCDQDIVLLAQRLCGTLKVLKIDGAMLSDEGVSALAQCVHLRTLYVRHAYSITDSGAAQLARLRALESLDLTGMGQVSPGGWARLFADSSWAQMRRLSLALCLTVNDDTLRQVARACPNLVKLILAGCMHVTEDGLTSVIQSCTNLESLNICLAHVYVFSSFVWIPTHTPNLKRLVYHPYGLEEENLILKFLGDTLPDLEIIRVDHPVEGIIREI